METKKNGTNGLIYKTEMESQRSKANMVKSGGEKGGRRRDKLGVLDWHIHTTIYKITNKHL